MTYPVLIYFRMSNIQDYNSYIFGDDAIFSVFLGKNPNDGSKNYLNKVA